MPTPRVYFRPTTASQRHLLIRVWQDTGDPLRAAQAAHVCLRTFYYWKRRFVAGGLTALDHCAPRGPKQPYRIAPAIEQEVCALRRAQPTWGKLRIAQELAKAHDWQPVVAPNTVRRILQDAALWPAPPEAAKKGGPL